MPSRAALQGIKAHGLAWRFDIHLSGITKRLGDLDSLRVGDITRIRDQLVSRLRWFVAHQRAKGSPGGSLMLIDLEIRIDDLEMCEDDPDQFLDCLESLYDEFDYYRILVR